jgi:hypothetical protein
MRRVLLFDPPKVCVSALVNSLNGVSSRRIRRKYPPSIRKNLGGGALWSPSSFAGSCGGAPIAVIRWYIEARIRSKSSRGNTEAPGKNVRAQSGLNKAILDPGWFEFRRQFEYQLNWNGGRLIKVPPHPTRQTCPACGHVAAQPSKPSQLRRRGLRL